MIIRMRRLLRAPDAGITLSELLVAMALTAVALAMVGAFFSGITRLVTTGRATRVGTSIAANATNELSRVIRTATTNAVAGGTSTSAVVDGTDTTLTVISYIDTDVTTFAPTKVSFAVDAAGNLVETRVAARLVSSYWTFTGATTSRTIAGPVSATAQIFTYYDSSGAVVAPGAGGLTAAQEASVVSVGITVTAANRTTDPVQISVTAVMNNLTLS